MSIGSEQKKILTNNLTKNLPVLRAKLGINQAELADKIGMTRQTLTAIESGKREMTWVTFVALTLLFMQNEDAKALLPVVNVYNNDLEKFFSFGGDK
ncbi:MAG: helix-turn-helix transcriptional regulator [Clostridiales bacterium]|nr:helix-turn-helix transcriptional regulator [Clostridiales bacterium]